MGPSQRRTFLQHTRRPLSSRDSQRIGPYWACHSVRKGRYEASSARLRCGRSKSHSAQLGFCILSENFKHSAHIG
eukprot:3669226-Rhodomonas_salina.2